VHDYHAVKSLIERLEERLTVEATTCPSCGRSWLVTEEEVAGVFGVCPSCGEPSPTRGLTGLEVVAVS
jgi:predicted RNA-binding Zn-ribbon protein involved in translation (DUF1610 family)